jgi:uncharacterized protein Veg
MTSTDIKIEAARLVLEIVKIDSKAYNFTPKKEGQTFADVLVEQAQIVYRFLTE